MDWDVVAEQAAKTIVAQALGFMAAGAKEVTKTVGRKLGALLVDQDTLRRDILRAAKKDPAFGWQLIADMAAVNGSSDAPSFPAPQVFYDRTEIRSHLRESGFYVIAGLRQSGKTALLFQACHDVMAECPGGAVYIDTDEFRHGEALSIDEIRVDVLRQLGIPVEDLAPARLAQQYQAALLRRSRFVLALDNVVSSEERQALVPWISPDNIVLVTTRRLDDGLRAWPKRVLLLEGLDEQGAWDLLAYRCREAIEAEPDVTRELLALCDRLPGAVAQAGVLVSRFTGAPGAVAVVRDRLAGPGDPGEMIRESLSGTVDALSAAAAQDLIGLATQPIQDFSLRTLVAVLRQGPDELIDTGLLAIERGRYRLPWLVRNFACRLYSDEPDAVFDRLLTFYRNQAVAADLAGDSPGRDRLRRYPVPAGLVWPGSRRDALDWLEAEVAAISALAERGFAAGRHTEVLQLCGPLETLLTSRGHHWLIYRTNEWGILAAQDLGDTVVEARLHAVQARILIKLRLLDRAAEALAKAERLMTAIEDPRMSSSLLEFQGSLALARKDYARAADAFSRCLIMDEQNGLDRAAWLHHRMLADALVHLDLPEEALATLDRARAFTIADDARNQSRVCTVEARAFLALGDLSAAFDQLMEAKRLAAEAKATQYEAELALVEGDIALRRGDVETARECWDPMVTRFLDTGDRRFEDFLDRIKQLPPPPEQPDH